MPASRRCFHTTGALEMPRVVRAQRRQRDAAYFAQAVYGEALRLGALATPQASIDAYLVRALGGQSEQQTLLHGLLVTQSFLLRAPNGEGAARARQAISRALARLSPRYARTLNAVMHFRFRKVAASLNVEMQALAHRYPGNEQQNARLAGISASQDTYVALWPRAMFDERLALHWACLGSKQYIDALAAATRVFPIGWDVALFSSVRSHVDGVYDGVPPVLFDPVCAGEYETVDCLNSVYTLLGKPSIKALISNLMMTSGRKDGWRENAQLHRAVLSAHAGLDIRQIHAFLCSTLGKVYLEGLEMAHAKWTEDGVMLQELADINDDELADARAWDVWPRN